MAELIIVSILIVLNGLFVMSEIALVSARKSRLETAANKGDDKAKVALSLSENPEIFLSAAQIGITLIAILTGYYSGETLAPKFSPVIERLGIFPTYSFIISKVLIVGIVTPDNIQTIG